MCMEVGGTKKQSHVFGHVLGGGTAVSVHESVTPHSRRERAGSFSREHLDRLESMGFEPAAAREALEQARGNMQQAVALLTRQAAQ